MEVPVLLSIQQCAVVGYLKTSIKATSGICYKEELQIISGLDAVRKANSSRNHLLFTVVGKMPYFVICRVGRITARWR